MAFPTALTNAVDGVTEIIAAHLNNLEAKVGIDSSAVTTSLDYLLKSTSSTDPGHKHSTSALPMAVQSDQETGTSTTLLVSPGVQKYHPSACKGWVDFAGNSTTIAASYNVTSITDATNRSTVNWTVSFSGNAYGCSVCITDTAAKVGIVRSDNKFAGSLMIDFYLCADGTASDPYACEVIACGDQ